MCVCDKGPTGKKLLPTVIPEQYFEQGSPYGQNFLFGNAGMSFNDLKNKGIVVFTVDTSSLFTCVMYCQLIIGSCLIDILPS